MQTSPYKQVLWSWDR